MPNTTKVCTRYEMEIYGAALFRAIKEKGSKLMLLVLFFITVFIGYMLLFYRPYEEDEEESVREETADRKLILQSGDGESVGSKFGEEKTPEMNAKASTTIDATQDTGIESGEARRHVRSGKDSVGTLLKEGESSEKDLTNYLRHRQAQLDRSGDTLRYMTDETTVPEGRGPTEELTVQERPLKSVQEVVNRESLSDKSDTTIRRKSSRWDHDDEEQAEEEYQDNGQFEGATEITGKESPILRSSVGAGRPKLHHIHSTEEFKGERKTWSDTDMPSRAASVDGEWMEREKFFETLHSARSSISASSLSLLVGSTSQERLSEHSLQSLSEREPAKEGSIPPSETSRLQRTVQQLYSGRIEDRFNSLEEVSKAIEEAGLVHSRIIIGIDYTTSNMETGRKTFGGKCLHTIKHGQPNPYQEVIRILCKTLNQFDEDNMICAYGFGDSRTNDRHVFKLNPASLYCHGFEGVLDAYNLITPIIKLGGPTTFAPIIQESIKIVQSSRMYTILILIADGQLVDERDTVEAIVEASNYPLSIVLVGVGDGPWDKMREFDDALPQRKFDNFQFVNYHQVMKLSGMLPGQSPDSLFALMALMEIPDQYLQIKQLGYLEEATGRYRRSIA